MENEFVSYEIAVDMKSIGFNEPCFTYYYNIVGKLRTNIPVNIGDSLTYESNKKSGITLAPTFSQAFRWFREKYNMLGNVYSNASGWLWEIHDNIGGTHRFGSEWSGDCEESGMFTLFEKAELECLKKLIQIVKNKNNEKPNGS